jgi:hypothetical protein
MQARSLSSWLAMGLASKVLMEVFMKSGCEQEYNSAGEESCIV